MINGPTGGHYAFVGTQTRRAQKKASSAIFSRQENLKRA